MSKSLPPVHPINVDALSKKFGMLEETRAELLKQKDKYPNDSVERSTIEQQIISIDNKIKEEEEARNKNKSSGPEKSSSSDGLAANNAGAATGNFTNTPEFSNLSNNRQEISNIIADGIKNNSITKTAEGPNVSSINEQILSFKNKETLDSVVDQVHKIYDNLEVMGLDVRRAEKSEGEKSASFYAIRFPKAYEGQRDVMKMTQEEINEIKSHYEKETPEQKKSVDSRDYETSVLGHVSLATNNKLISDSLGLKKVGEKSANNKENNKGKTMVQKLLEQQQQISNLANSR